MKYEKLKPEDLNLNVFDKIGKEWMLVSAYDESKKPLPYNTMTASWGGMGVMWNKNIFICAIRPQRYTFGFAEKSDIITVSFFDKKYKKALSLCGTLSGRDCDKIAAAGLTPVIENSAVFFEQATLTFVGKKLYSSFLEKSGFCDDSILPDCYPNNDFHKMYACEIIEIRKNAK